MYCRCCLRWLVACCFGLCIVDLLIVLVLSLTWYNSCLWFCYVVLCLWGFVGCLFVSCWVLCCDVCVAIALVGGFVILIWDVGWWIIDLCLIVVRHYVCLGWF